MKTKPIKREAYLLFFIAWLSLQSCTSSPNVPSAEQKTPAIPATPKASQVHFSAFDVPALLNLSIDQITAELGKPAQPDSPNLSQVELERRYTKNNYLIIITYNKSTRLVESVVASSNAEKSISYLALLKANNLHLDNKNYKINVLNRNNSNFKLAFFVKNVDNMLVD